MKYIKWIAVACLAAAPVCQARAESWVAERIQGRVTVETAAGNAGLHAGMEVPYGGVLVTAPGARAKLVRGNGQVLVGPGSTIKIDTNLFGTTTTVEQRAGVVEFDVEKRAAPYFKVETPLLAAVVKGTRFKVSVARGVADLTVERGLVGVTDRASGQSADVGPGQRASSRSERAGLTLGGRLDKAHSREAAAASIASSASQADESQPSGISDDTSGVSAEKKGGKGRDSAGSGGKGPGGQGGGKGGAGGSPSGGPGNGNGPGGGGGGGHGGGGHGGGGSSHGGGAGNGGAGQGGGKGGGRGR